MKFNVTTKDATFYVNKKNKTVVCVIDTTRKLFINFAEDNFKITPNCDFLYSINNKQSINTRLTNKLEMPNRFVGVARCGEDDEWNEEIGRAIAFSRAKDSLLDSFWKRLNTYFDTIQEWLIEAVDISNALGEKLEVNKAKRHERIEKLLGEEK